MGIRFALGAAFLLMGFSFSITQTVMVRELLVSFSGNEMSIGLVLGSWLALEAAGAGLLSRLSSPQGRGASRYARLQAAFALLLIPALWVAFGIRNLLGGVPGQALGLFPTFAASFLVLVPLGLVDGAMFEAGCRLEGECRPDPGAAGRVYVAEAVGGIVGGLVFTFLLIPHMHSVQVALLLAALNLASALSLLSLRSPSGLGRPRRRASLIALGALLALAVAILASPIADALHRRLVDWQWRGYDLAFYGNSVYGNVAAIRQGHQVTFFANGVPILTSPEPDIALAEELVHLPLLYVPRPRAALVLSGGLGGVVHELLKYPLERVDYAELDPLLIEAVQSIPTPLTEAELGDPRLRIAEVDGRLLVRQLAARRDPPRYDVIIMNLPTPTTLQLNRFYTAEFWQAARLLLADGGVLVFPAPASLSYLSPAMRDLHNALHATLAQAFPHVWPIPDEVTLWLASASADVETVSADALVERWRERRLPSRLMTERHIRLKLDERRLSWFRRALEEGGPIVVNRDLRPAGLLYGLALWNEMFSPRFAPLFASLKRLNFPIVGAPLLLGALAAAVAVRLRLRRRAAPIRVAVPIAVPVAIAATGFGGMTADLLIIFAFQAYYGYVYHLIALLLAAFMAGLSLGGRLMTQNVGRISDRYRLFLGLEVGLVCFWLALPMALMALYGAGGRVGAPAFVGPALMALNAMAGFLVGAQFPLANRLCLDAHAEASRAAGMLYAVDLVGAFAAAIVVSVVLLPALGIVQTCLLVAVLKVGSLLLVGAARTRPPAA